MAYHIQWLSVHCHAKTMSVLHWSPSRYPLPPGPGTRHRHRDHRTVWYSTARRSAQRCRQCCTTSHRRRTTAGSPGHPPAGSGVDHCCRIHSTCSCTCTCPPPTASTSHWTPQYRWLVKERNIKITLIERYKIKWFFTTGIIKIKVIVGLTME